MGEVLDVLAASKQLRKWVTRGQLVVLNPDAAKQFRRYTKPGTPPTQTFLMYFLANHRNCDLDNKPWL